MRELQQRIIAQQGVLPEIDPAAEVERRVAFLADYLAATGASGFVLGISGGVDSTVGGRLGVKASGGIRDFATASAMVEAGATRLGLSASAQILAEAGE